MPGWAKDGGRSQVETRLSKTIREEGVIHVCCHSSPTRAFFDVEVLGKGRLYGRYDEDDDVKQSPSNEEVIGRKHCDCLCLNYSATVTSPPLSQYRQLDIS